MLVFEPSLAWELLAVAREGNHFSRPLSPCVLEEASIHLGGASCALSMNVGGWFGLVAMSVLTRSLSRRLGVPGTCCCATDMISAGKLALCALGTREIPGSRMSAVRMISAPCQEEATRLSPPRRLRRGVRGVLGGVLGGGSGTTAYFSSVSSDLCKVIPSSFAGKVGTVKYGLEVRDGGTFICC